MDNYQAIMLLAHTDGQEVVFMESENRDWTIGFDHDCQQQGCQGSDHVLFRIKIPSFFQYLGGAEKHPSTPLQILLGK